MAAYSVRSSKYDSARLGERQREKRSGYDGHGAGLVRVLATDCGYNRLVGYDTEYPAFRQVDG